MRKITTTAPTIVMERTDSFEVLEVKIELPEVTR